MSHGGTHGSRPSLILIIKGNTMRTYSTGIISQIQHIIIIIGLFTDLKPGKYKYISNFSLISLGGAIVTRYIQPLTNDIYSINHIQSGLNYLLYFDLPLVFNSSFKYKYINQPEKINLFVNHASTKYGKMGTHHMAKCETFIQKLHGNSPSISSYLCKYGKHK